MNLNFTICPLATVVLLCVIIINILDIYVAGTTIIVLTMSVLISVFFVWVANKTCFSYRWVSWLIVVYLVISIIGYIVIIVKPELIASDPKLKKMIVDDQETRKEIRKFEENIF